MDPLPSPHDRKWRGIGRVPDEFRFTREEYAAWHARGMIPRGLRLLWVGGNKQDPPRGFILAHPPPRRLTQAATEAGEVARPVAPSQ